MIFDVVPLTADHERLRAEVRDFLASTLPPSARSGLGMNGAHDPQFSRRLAARGWVGMSIPEEYGGHGRTAVERFVVIEELLAAGAPINAHWIADRQTAPAILKFGTEAQRRRFLPAIARGECYFSIGMSEPDTGSDLASVRSRAHQVTGGWQLNGTKIWTSGAHLNHYVTVLCRTSDATDRHDGLSQLMVDLAGEGVSVRPIPFLNGAHHFNEVSLRDVFVPDDMVLGRIGSGWEQVTSELADERSAPDRYMSPYLVVENYLRFRTASLDSDVVREALGRLAARWWTIRQLALSVAAARDAGRSAAAEAALVKDLGTSFEQQVIDVVATIDEADPSPAGGDMYQTLLAECLLTAPSYTLRGGTTEVLRSVAARALGVR